MAGPKTFIYPDTHYSNDNPPPHMTSFRPEKIAILLEAARIGLSKDRCCEAAGIGERSLRRMLIFGRSGITVPQDFKAFYVQYHEAVQSSMLRRLKLLETAAEKDPRIHMWFLERLYPGDFGKEAVLIRNLRAGIAKLLKINQELLSLLPPGIRADLTPATIIPEVESLADASGDDPAREFKPLPEHQFQEQPEKKEGPA